MTRARVVTTDDQGRWTEADVTVKRSYTLRVDCGCWSHFGRRGFHMDVIETNRRIYFRPHGSEEHYREIGHSGPITVEPSEIRTESDE